MNNPLVNAAVDAAILAIPGIPEPLRAPLAELVQLVIDAPNPIDAIERAKYYAAADAAKLAADEALRRELG